MKDPITGTCSTSRTGPESTSYFDFGYGRGNLTKLQNYSINTFHESYHGLYLINELFAIDNDTKE